MSTADDPLTALRLRIQTMHRHAGEPSTREIARGLSAAISHTTVHAVLLCRASPRWPHLELVVEALGGEVAEFRSLWIAVRDVERPLEVVSRQPAEMAAEGENAPATEGWPTGGRAAKGADGSRPQSGSSDSSDQRPRNNGSSARSGSQGKPHSTESIPVILAETRGGRLWDVNLPLDVALRFIRPKLAENSLLPFAQEISNSSYRSFRIRWHEGDRYLEDSESLRSAGVQPGDRLIAGIADLLPPFVLIIDDGVLGGIRQSCASSPGREVGGILLGDHDVNGLGWIVQVTECIIAPTSEDLGTDGHLALTASIMGALSQLGGDVDVVGWYHSHVVGELLLSTSDTQLHRTLFTKPWQVAMVMAPDTEVLPGVWRSTSTGPTQVPEFFCRFGQ